MEGLLAANPVEVPKALIGNEVNRLRVQAVQQFGGSIDPQQPPAELFEEQAKRRVALGLIVAEVVKQSEIKADEARVRELIEEMASAYQEPEQVVAWYYKNAQQLDEVRSVVLEEQVVDTVPAEGQCHRQAGLLRGSGQAGGSSEGRIKTSALVEVLP